MGRGGAALVVAVVEEDFHGDSVGVEDVAEGGDGVVDETGVALVVFDGGTEGLWFEDGDLGKERGEEEEGEEGLVHL